MPAHCFDISPKIVIKTTNKPDKLYHDKLSLLLAEATKQLINITVGDIIDIGAYNGKWADYVNNNCQDPSRRITLFEPAPAEYLHLVYKYKTYKRITVNNLGIAAFRGYESFMDMGADSTCLYEAPDKIPVTTYDSLYADRRIGIVKLRVNGYETNVLSRFLSCCGWST